MSISDRWKGLGLCLGILGVILAFIASLTAGVADLSPGDVIRGLISPATVGDKEAYLIRSVRFPRAVAAVLAGMSLAVAGALMQAFTRNSLASPDLLGVNQGAGLAVVSTLFLTSGESVTGYTWIAMAGALLAAVGVLGSSSMGQKNLSPLRLILAGSALTALLASITQGILILNQRSMDEMRFWLAGSLVGRDWEWVIQTGWLMVAGVGLALLVRRQVHMLSLGEEVAQGLGMAVLPWKWFFLVLVALLAGSSVALAGPIGFIGLVVPNAIRLMIGSDYRWVIPFSACMGAFLLLVADMGARIVLPSREVSVGVMTAFLGAPYFIWLARGKGGSG
ncbi:iron ABC transporter permease [Kroppenstedtia pulmonis]|uniref:Iron ABC transporter permease n=1 Tax=Kroppenstedtia pulmonis TaxID=1380685 RepID=A0A7D4CPQ6_9BACL|nr:iron ABC transporter permease [Kroppenstedtia pulmonis]QKG85498.1 iron ABC transporter permease [Kroppenstedtia pulmonis]